MSLSDLTPAERNQLLNVLWEQSLVGVALVREDGTFEYVNPTFCQVVEYSEPELQRKTYQEITHPEDVEADVALAEQVHDMARSSYVMRKRYLTKTGRIVWVILSVQPLTIDGEFRYFVSQISEVLPVLPVTPALVIKPKLDLLKLIKEHYPWAIILLGSVAYTISEVLRVLK